MANVWSSSSICRRAAIPPLLEPAAVSEKPEIFAVVESLWERICSFWILRRFGYAGALVSVAIGKSAIAVDLISCHSWKLKLVESTLKSVLLDAHRCLSKIFRERDKRDRNEKKEREDDFDYLANLSFLFGYVMQFPNMFGGTNTSNHRILNWYITSKQIFLATYFTAINFCLRWVTVKRL
ncbi:hypothetical protein YC2023_038857 [Brassica napus]